MALGHAARHTDAPAKTHGALGDGGGQPRVRRGRSGPGETRYGTRRDATACFVCGGMIDADVRTCAHCGTGQSEEARAAFRRAARLAAQGPTLAATGIRARVQRWVRGHPWASGAVAGTSMLAVGFLVGANVLVPAPTRPSEPLPRALLNTAFTAQLQADLTRLHHRMRIAGWEWGQDSSLVLLLTQPGPGDANGGLWQEMTPRQRGGLAGLIAVGYSRAWMQAGRPLDVRRQGHPVVTLRYSGMAEPLAQRAADGKIYVCVSPLDPRPVGTPVPMCTLPYGRRSALVGDEGSASAMAGDDGGVR